MTQLQQNIERALEGGASLEDARALMSASEQGQQAPMPRPAGRGRNRRMSATTSSNPAPAPLGTTEATDIQQQGATEVPHVFTNEKTGKKYRIYGPEGSTIQEAADIFFNVSDKDKEKFLMYDPREEISAWDRFAYEFQKTSNITTNLGYYLKGWAPDLLLAKAYYDDEEGLQFLTAEDQYGDMSAMTPEERTDHIQKVDQENLLKKYQGVEQVQNQMAEEGEWDVAGGTAMLAKTILDPLGMGMPGGQAVKGYQATKAAVGLGEKVAQGAKSGAKVGAIFGGAYGASEQLADTGLPTTGEQAFEGAGRVLGGAAVGAVGGAALGGAIPAGKAAISSRMQSSIRRQMESDVGVKRVGVRYWDEVWKAQIAGTPSYEAQKLARKKLGLTLDDVSEIRWTLKDHWDIFGPAGGQTLPAPGDAINRRGMARVFQQTEPSILTRPQKAFNWLVQPLDSRAKKLAPRVATMLTEMEMNNLRQAHDIHQEVLPYFNLHRKLSKGDRRKVSQHLYNSEFDEALEIIKRYHGQAGEEAFKRMNKALHGLAKAMKKEGMEFDTIENYFPRMIKDVEGLKKYLHSNADKFGSYQEALKKAKKKKGGGKEVELTAAEEVKILNRWLEYGDIGKHKVKKSVSSTKKRKVRLITDEMLDFYDDPITSMDLHIRDSVSGINRAKFFGRYKPKKAGEEGELIITRDKYGIENIDDSVAKKLKEMGLDKNPEVLDELSSILKSRFGKGEVSGARWLATARQGVGGLTLGNPYSALRQFGDVPAVIWLHGPVNTLKAVPKAVWITLRSQLGLKGDWDGMDADSFGYMLEMAQELDTGGIASNWIKKTSNGMYKYFGFKTVDRFGKNTLIHAAINKNRAWASSEKGRRKFMEKYGDSYDGAEIKQLMDDLKAGKMTDLVKTHISAEVMQIQPISRSQLPQAYLDHPNGRALFQFRTWGLKQLELVRSEILKDVLSTDPRRVAKGMGNLGYYTVLMGASGLGITQIQRHLTGRIGAIEDNSDIPDEVLLHMFANMGIDRYGMSKMIERTDPEYAMKGLFFPPAIEIPAHILAQSAATIKNTAQQNYEERNKHAKELVRNFGGFGRMIHWLFLGGAEEFNDKEIDKRLNGAL